MFIKQYAFSFPDSLLGSGPVTNLLKPFGIQTFYEALMWVWKLPYGRTSDRSNDLLVPLEQKGTCSSKHAFLARVAAEQSIPLHLNIGIFMMSEKNTPGVGAILKKFGLTEIIEAHSHLKFQGISYDFTFYQEASQPRPSIDFVHEELIEPHQIGDYKIQLHKSFLDKWAKDTCQKINSDDLWFIREMCIASLGKKN